MRAAAAVKRRTEMEALWSKGPTALAELRRKIAAASSPLQSQLEQAAMDLAQAQAAAQQPGRWGPVPGLPDALPCRSMVLAAAALVVMILCFMPVPLWEP